MLCASTRLVGMVVVILRAEDITSLIGLANEKAVRWVSRGFDDFSTRLFGHIKQQDFAVFFSFDADQIFFADRGTIAG